MRYSEDYWNEIDVAARTIPYLEKLYGTTILITGATGMVCSPVVDILYYLNQSFNAGIKIYLAGRSRERIASRFVHMQKGYEYVHYDALFSKVNTDVRYDYIIHGASNANPALYASEPVDTLLENIVGIDSLLKHLVQYGGNRLLNISSSEVYGIKEGNQPFSESEYGYVDISNPRACYPNGKRCAETLCAAYSKQYGIDYVTVRLGHIYGPTITAADNRASAAFTRDAVNGRDIVMKSSGNQIRSYCYTLDCATAILTVLSSGESGQAYNISNRDSVVSIRDLAFMLAQKGNVNVVFENPSDAEKQGYNLMPNSALNSDKLESLGWKGTYTLEKGVESTLRYI